MHPEAMGQKADDEDAGNVEQQAHAHHLAQPDLAGGIDDGVGRGGNGQHEGTRRPAGDDGSQPDVGAGRVMPPVYSFVLKFSL